MGKSIYTDTLINAKKLLNGWKVVEKKLGNHNHNQQQSKNKSGAAFVKWETVGKAGPNAICHGCGKKRTSPLGLLQKI